MSGRSSRRGECALAACPGRPAQAGIQASGELSGSAELTEDRAVVETSHFRGAGMTITGMTTQRAIRQNLPPLHHPGLPSGCLGCLFQTCLQQAGAALPPRPGGHPSRGGELEPLQRLVPDLPAAGRRRSTTARLSSPNALHPCRRASMQASLRWNDDGGGNRIVVILTTPLLFLTNA